MNKIEHQLLWLLSALWEDGQALLLARLPSVLDELERLLLTEPQAQELLSTRIAGVIGNLSIIAQCLSELDLYQPWAAGFDSALVEREDKIKQQFSDFDKPMAVLMEALSNKILAKAAWLGDPSDQKFFYPSEKRRTKEHTAALQQAERGFDAFWAAVDHMLNAVKHKLALHPLSRRRVLQRTPDLVDRPTAKPQTRETVSNASISNLRDASRMQLDDLQARTGGDREHDSAKRIVVPMSVKTKTTGTSREIAPVTMAVDVEIRTEKTALHIDSRALKVFRTLFFNPDVTSSPGEVSWTDFVHAMTSKGFTAEKLYGSVWQFENMRGKGQSSIQFHKPHLRAKMPFITARRHGRRLTERLDGKGPRLC